MSQRVAFFACRRPRPGADGRRFTGRSLISRAFAALCPAAAALLAADAGAAPDPAPPPEPAATAEPSATAAAPAVDREGALLALGRDLELVVTETGPEQPWTLHLHNRGTSPIGLMADPGLLWFEVAVPGSSTPHVCRLPEPLWPKHMRRRAVVTLAPGERFSRRFDPRFFCFHDLVQTTLVPNARVLPHFGWPVETQSTTVKGKRVEQALPSRAPFVAWVPEPAPAGAAVEPALDADADDEDSGDEARIASEASWEPPKEGLKNVEGSAIVLADSYAKWSERVPSPSDGLQVAMLAGSDAEDERAAIVTVGIGNAGSEPQTVVLRRDLMSFDVRGPDGSFECPAGEMGPPELGSFTTLRQRASERFVVRLIEMCPRGSFSRPGLYEVSTTLHAKFSGQAMGIEAFVGTVSSSRPALVRVRSGERASFLRAAPLVAGSEGGAQAPGGEAAEGEGTVEPQPTDDGAGEHEAAPPDEAPPPEAPAPEGTSVE
jgi:hypothetical protein